MKVSFRFGISDVIAAICSIVLMTMGINLLMSGILPVFGFALIPLAFMLVICSYMLIRRDLA